jgi:hypothetical protein
MKISPPDEAEEDIRQQGERRIKNSYLYLNSGKKEEDNLEVLVHCCVRLP